MAEAPFTVHVADDDTETIHVDPDTGTIERHQPDGRVVVQLDAQRPPAADAEDDDWFANLANALGDMELTRIANDLFEAITADDNSRAEYLQIRTRGLGLLGTKLQEPRSTVGDSSSAVDGMATVSNPLLLEACLKGWANAQAELLPASGPVKIKDDGEETTQEDELADSLERDMNHWFTTTAAEYYPDTSDMLLWGTYFGGSGFKKIYRCPMRRRPVSESVSVQHLIVSDATKDLRNCARITHEIPMRPSVMKRMKFIGAYRDVQLTQPTPNVNVVDAKIGDIQGTASQRTRPEDQPYTVWESQCEIDLDKFIPRDSPLKGEGIPLPFVITMDKDTRDVLALRRDWDKDDPDCERKRMYVKYPYVPGPGFYGTGLLNILGNASAAMTAVWRLALDCAMFANFPSGFISKLGSRQNTSDYRMGPGQWPQIETGDRPIGDVLFPNPYRDVTPGLFNLANMITEQAKAVGAAADIPAGEGLQNVPVGTMLAQIEQATKIEAAVHKGMHTAQSLEIELIIDLFRAHPEDFWRNNKVAPTGYWDEQKLLAALDNCKLVPVSDPNVPSHIHRVAKGVALIQLQSNPAFAPFMSPQETLRRALRALREDPTGLVVTPPPQAAGAGVDPSKMVDAQAKMLDSQTKAKKAEIDAAGQQRGDMLKSEEVAAKERVANIDLKKEVIIHAHDADREIAAERLAERAQTHDEALAHAKHIGEQDQRSHEQTMDHARHALDMHEALKPEPPKKPANKA